MEQTEKSRLCFRCYFFRPGSWKDIFLSFGLLYFMGKEI